MRFLTVALCVMPGLLFAAGGGSSTPPSSTQTSTCPSGTVWDAAKRQCVSAQQSSLTDDQRYDAVRELAYAGRIDAAQAVLATMTDQTEDRVLTYWGFTHGKQGNLDEGLQFYQAALTQNPDNILARSYMGQALVAAGRIDEATQQYQEVLARDGAESWAATSLLEALRTGRGYSY